jgi:diguanylate cyclase (GGDEF)-like protein
MKPSGRSFSLAARLRSILWAMLLFPIVAGVGFFVVHSVGTLEEKAEADLKAALLLQQQFIESWMAERAWDLRTLASDPRILSLPDPPLRELLADILETAPGFTDIVYVARQGQTRADPRSIAGINVSDREYFRAAVRGRSFVSDVLTSRLTGAEVFIVSSPVYDARGDFQGAMVGEVSLEALSTLMRTVQDETTSRTFLLRSNGDLLAPSGRGRGLAGTDALFQRALANAPSQGVYRNAAGERVVGTYKWVLGGKWLLVGERLERDILAVSARTLGVPMLGATLAFLIFGPTVLRLARSLDAPLRRLEEHARQIEAGHFEVACPALPEAGVPEEVRRLNQAYCLMVGRVRAALDALREASFTDHLTGAGNRKLLFSEGLHLLDAARRAGQPVSLLMLDLDYFKRVNDTHGHAAGDAVLVGFSELLRGALRQSDLFVRYGGEEFVVLAPNAGSSSVRELAERIRKAVERLEVPVGEAVLRFTVSIGAASLEGPAKTGERGSGDADLEALLARADEALYVAKGSGRNRLEYLPMTSAPVSPSLPPPSSLEPPACAGVRCPTCASAPPGC